ncbi:MAG: DUF483 domain-containing protein [Xanthobacteraceae bacterium]
MRDEARRWKSDLQKLIELRGAALQVAQYIAVISGLKRSLDDWIPVGQFERFRSLVEALGLAMEIDCVFRRLSDAQSVFGLRYAPTTHAMGFHARDADGVVRAAEHFAAEDEVHLMLARRPEHAAETLAAAWYPLVINNRVTHRPHVDSYRLGSALGYPDCCVKFFMEHNDWPRQNQIAETAKASRSISWKANCLAKNTPHMLIFHMPCSFDCVATLQYSTNLIHEVRQFDRDKAEQIESYLKQTILVSSERLAFRLIDAAPSEGDRVSYGSARSLQEFIRLRDPQHDEYLAALKSGSELSISEGTVFVWNKGQLANIIETRCDEWIAEVPQLLRFEDSQ